MKGEKRMLEKLLKILPKNEIVDECHDGSGLLMTRYYLTPKIFGCRLVIHQFHRSDNDRHYHDHPWNFISLILKGSYIEHFPVGNVRLDIPPQDIQQAHQRWDIIKRPKTWKHWVELHKKPNRMLYEECWTLVLLYGQRRNWGFWTKEGWIKHDQYDCRGYTNGGDKLSTTKKSNA
jgi:hypothetical protein